MKGDIDFSILWKKINNQQLTPAEEELLNTWLVDDQTHNDYFNNAQRYLTQGPEKATVDPLNASKKIKFRMYVLPLVRRSMRYASAFILVFFIGFLWMTYMSKQHGHSFVTGIKPGVTKASLTLSNGTMLDLGKTNPALLSEKGVMIVSIKNGLRYEAIRHEKRNLSRKEADKPAMNILNVPRGGEYFLVLSDGTKVWLNSETELRYPVSFAVDYRKVEITGEAYFEVAHDSKRPFLVTSGKQQVRVLGTGFNISAYPEDRQIKTTLVTGHVEIGSTINKLLNVTLSPGEQATYDKTTGEVTANEIEIDPVICWKDGKYKFNEQPLKEMLNTLSRWYDFEVYFENDQLSQVKFTGSLARTYDFKKVLNIIEETNEVKFEINGKKVIIK